MSGGTRQGRLRIALAGNPNAGKTSLFNALTGARHKVGNYPGVTVEKREGSRIREGREYRFIDLPGIYSLTAYSIDEVVTRDCLLDERPDLIIDVLDSTNLERHLYLCLQFQELGIPVVGALNMSDEAKAQGISIDSYELGKILGIPMTATVARTGEGIEELLDLADRAAAGGSDDLHRISYGPEIEPRLAALELAIAADPDFARRFPARWLAVKLLEKDGDALERLGSHRDAAAIAALARESAAWIGTHFGKDAEIVISGQRYGYIHGATRETLRLPGRRAASLTDAIDAVVMHPFLALPIFALTLWGVFSLTFALGAYPTAWLDAFFRWLAASLGPVLPGGALRSLVVDGVIAGVGGVLSFVPLIVLLFFLISVLEDTGYMSRAAFATDRALHAFGLHGQSVFPMMLGFGCSVPAIMAARTLKSPRDRILTIMIIPFMSCGAKLPVHVLLAAAFFPRHAAAAVMAIYAVGVALALGSAWVLRRTALRGEPTPFVMELPPWRRPTLRGLLWHVWENTAMYARKAGTVILAASILVWAVTSYPRHEVAPGEREAMAAAWSQAHPAAGSDDLEAGLSRELAERSMTYSFAGRFGKAIEPLVAPLGFDWRIGVATVTGFAAKEVVVSTLGILYGVGAGKSEGAGLRSELAADPAWTPLVAFCLMLFILLIPPCFAALATMKTELGWSWLGFALAFQLSLGWLVAFAVFSIGTMIGIAA